MQFTVTFRHMDATNALKDYAEKRCLRFKKYFADPISCDVTMITDKRDHHVDVSVHLQNGFRIAAEETTENMYSSIDLVAAKIERQVRRYKDKLKHHKVAKKPLAEIEAKPVFHSLFAEPTHGEEAAGVEAPSTPAEPMITSREQLEAGQMSLADAVMQLNLLHVQFYVFRDEKSGDVNVVYKHDAGGYGLIETGRTE